MVLNQDLSKVVPTSRLSEELNSRKTTLQDEISRLEQQLRSKPQPQSENQEQGDIRKVKDEDGQVRIWSSSSTSSS
jgi:hypothetical protein